MSDDLTAPQHRCLQALADLTVERPTVRPRAVAKALWPDSPAWERRTRGRRTGTINGAVGGTMPMKAATLLWRLEERGLACEDDRAWRVTDRGRRVLAGTDAPLPKPVRRTIPDEPRPLKDPR